MIVVVASQWNKGATSFASRWPSGEAGVLTPRDLSIAGWRQRVSAQDWGSVVVEGRAVSETEITGVLTMLPDVYDRELVHINPGDRRFVASEMTAFLLFWLSRLECPVLNRPTAACLSGPSWRNEYWIYTAAKMGIPVRPVQRSTNPSSPLNVVEAAPTILTVVGEQVVGDADPVLKQHAINLCRTAEVELLSLQFSGAERDARLVGVDVFPDLADDAVATAVVEYLRGTLL
ncbi:MAG: hypothetical protein JOZ83_10665 [Silvibacterium sp.]|nr:hypothetical protein [Silvibacterium sp.]